IHGQLEVAVIEAHAGGERVAKIALANDPAGVGGPEQVAAAAMRNVGEDAKTTRPGAGVVFLPDMGEVDVSDLVLVVERDEQSPVADRNITRHAYSLVAAMLRLLLLAIN